MSPPTEDVASNSARRLAIKASARALSAASLVARSVAASFGAEEEFEGRGGAGGGMVLELADVREESARDLAAR